MRLDNLSLLKEPWRQPVAVLASLALHALVLCGAGVLLQQAPGVPAGSFELPDSTRPRVVHFLPPPPEAEVAAQPAPPPPAMVVRPARIVAPPPTVVPQPPAPEPAKGAPTTPRPARVVAQGPAPAVSPAPAAMVASTDPWPAAPPAASGGKSEVATASQFAPPCYLDTPTPAYPQAARRRGLEGRVLLEVGISESGKVATAVVRESSGHAVLDQAGLAAVRRWKFQPARMGDVAISGSILVPVRFRLE